MKQSVFSDVKITDFLDPRFQNAFKSYFAELGIVVRDWDGLFREMSQGEGTTAIVRSDPTGAVIGFIIYETIELKSWFFEKTAGFIREFWVANGFRGLGHGSDLLRLVEEDFGGQGIRSIMLTTDTAEGFYQTRGFRLDPSMKAKNGDPVYVKELS